MRVLKSTLPAKTGFEKQEKRIRLRNLGLWTTSSSPSRRASMSASVFNLKNNKIATKSVERV